MRWSKVGVVPMADSLANLGKASGKSWTRVGGAVADLVETTKRAGKEKDEAEREGQR